MWRNSCSKIKEASSRINVSCILWLRWFSYEMFVMNGRFVKRFKVERTAPLHQRPVRYLFKEEHCKGKSLLCTYEAAHER